MSRARVRRRVAQTVAGSIVLAAIMTAIGVVPALATTYQTSWNQFTGELTSGDPVNTLRPQSRWDRFVLSGATGSTVNIYLKAGTLCDPFLQVANGGAVIVEDDDSGDGGSDGYNGVGCSGNTYDSYLSVPNWQPQYEIRATAYSGGLGTYRLYVSIGSASDIGSKSIQTITFGSLGSRTYGDAPFGVSANASSGLSVSFASTTAGVCSVSGSTVTLLSNGSCTIRASQSGNSSWAPAGDVDQTFTVNQKTLTVTGITAVPRAYADSASVTLSGSGTLSGLVSGDESLVTLGGTPVGTVSNRNVGTQAVTVSGFSISGTKSGNYTLSQPTGVTVAIGQKTVNVSGSRAYNGSGTVAASDLTVATGVAGQSLTLSGTGSITNPNAGSGKVLDVSGLTLGNGTGGLASNYTLAGGTHTFTVIGANQSALTVSSATTGGTIGQNITLTTSGGSGGGAITWSNGSSTACTVDSSGVVTITSGTGTCAITATKDGDAGFNPVTSNSLSITINKAAQSPLTIGGSSSAGYGTTVPLTRSGGTGTGAITWSNGSSTACTVDSSGVVTITSGTGTCAITVTKATDNDYLVDTSAPHTITVAKIAQNSLTISGVSTGDFGTTLSLTRSGGTGTGAITWSNGSSTACTVDSSGVVTITSGTGTCAITVTKATDNNYLVDTSAPHTITVAKIAQSPVTVAGSTTGTFGNTVNLSASGGTLTGSLTWSDGSSSACSVNSSGVVTITSGTGTCAITATRPGNDDYNSRVSATHSISVARANQSPLLVTGPASGLFGQTIDLVAAGGDGTGNLTWSDGSSTACNVNSNGVVTITSGTGTCAITVTKAQTADHNQIVSAAYSIAVDRASQSISIGNPGAVRVGGSSPTLAVNGAQTSPVTWATTTSAVCGIGATTGVVTPIAVGDCDITASVPSSAQYGSSTASRTIAIGAGELAAPAPVTIASVTSTSIVARVTPVANATSYDVRLYRSNTVIVTVSLDAIAVATDVSFSSLDPASTYRVTVTALSDDTNWLQSTESQPAEATTSAIPTPASRLLTLPEGSTDPTLVSVSDSPLIERDPGDAAAIVDGVLTPLIRTVVDDPAARVPPNERTPEQVAAIQAAAQSLFQQLVEALPEGQELAVEIRNTPTGAEIFGLVADPTDGALVSIPIESVVLLTGQGAGALIAAVDPNLNPTSSITGGLIVLPSGFIAVKAYGFTPGSIGEIVFFSTPRKLAGFTADASGAVIGQVQVPSDIGLGDHTFVVATPETKLTAGVSVRAATSLPRTGDEKSPLMSLALALFALGGVAVVYRRRPDEPLFARR